MLKLPSLVVAVGLAALSIVGATSANAQSATSCPGGSDKNASDCLLINLNGAQQSLIEINEQDEIDSPGKQWSISGQVQGDPDRIGQWIALTEPGSSAISDVVGIPQSGTIAFVSDAADFSPFNIFMTIPETSGPLDITNTLLSAADRAGGLTAFFTSDVESTVPEPSTWAMMLLGFVGLGYAGWRRTAKREAALA